MKLKEFQKCLKQQKIDLAIFVQSDPNLTYFTQFKPSQAMLVIRPRRTILYLSKLDGAPVLEGIKVKELSKQWKKDCANEKVKRVGINKEAISVAFFDKLKKIFPKTTFVNLNLSLRKLRAQKTPVEIKKITRACKITTIAFNELILALRKRNLNSARNKLKTEQDVALFLEKKISEQGAGLAFPTIVATGKNSAVPHHQTSTTKLKKGFLLLDFGACYQHYCADMTRAIYLGKPSKVEEKMYSLLLETQQKTIQQVIKQKSFSDLEAFAKKQLGKYSSYFIHSLGHGLGIEIHEAPSFISNQPQLIEKNQLFTIEPGIYFPTKFGLRIEDTVMFDGKVKILTKCSKELIRI